MGKRLCIDIGFGDTKIAEMVDGVISSYKKETNAIAQLADETDVIKYTGTEKDVVKFHDKFYLVGKDALQYPDVSVMEVMDYDTMCKISPLIALKYINKSDEYEQITFTLSSAFRNYSEDYRNHLVNELNMPKEKVKIIPQGAGCKVTIDNIGLDLGNPSSKSTYKNYLIIDIGFNTIDVAAVIGNSLMPGDIKGHQGEGVVNVAKYVVEKFKGQGIGLSISRARSILYDGAYKVRDKVYDCRDYIKAGIDEYLDHLKLFLENNYGNRMDAIDNVIIFGGGAELIKNNSEKWKTLFGEGFMITPVVDAEYYNAVGGLFI